MKENKVRQTAELVKDLMENDKKAREDDFYLYGEVIKLFGVSTRCHLNTIFRYIRQKRIPPFETVNRARRRIQELYPELRANDFVESARLDKSEQYIDFIQDKRV